MRQLTPKEALQLVGLHPHLQPLAQLLIDAMNGWCADKPYSLHLIEHGGARTHAEQAVLYAQGRTTPGPIVTHANAGQSPHEKGAALDVAFLMDTPPHAYASASDPCWAEYGRQGEALSLIWGGRWPQTKRDLPHVELPDWRSL